MLASIRIIFLDFFSLSLSRLFLDFIPFFNLRILTLIHDSDKFSDDRIPFFVKRALKWLWLEVKYTGEYIFDLSDKREDKSEEGKIFVGWWDK